MNAPGPTTHTGRANGRLFAIASVNTWVHVYPDQQRLLQCEDPIAVTGPVDYFDVGGRRFDPILDGAGKLVGLRETTDPPNDVAVRTRLCAVVKHLRATAEDRLAEAPEPPGNVEEALAQLPELEGQSLSKCHDLLGTAFGDDGGLTRDNGSFWHNFWCH